MTTVHTVTGNGGLKLHVREWGKTDGAPIVLIHGWSQNHLCWSKQYESALARNFRLVAFDIRGHGMSEAPLEVENYNTPERWADDVKAVIDALELHRPVLAGWSYGGLIIGDYVRVHGTGAVAALNFVGAPPALNEDALGTLVGPGFVDHFEGATSDDLPTSLAAIIAFVHDCFEIMPTPAEFETILAFNAIVNPKVRANLAAREVDNKDVLATIDIPVLVTHGTADITVLPASAECFMQSCPTAKVSWYDGVGHAPFFEDPDRFNREIAELRRSAD